MYRRAVVRLGRRDAGSSHDGNEGLHLECVVGGRQKM